MQKFTPYLLVVACLFGSVALTWERLNGGQNAPESAAQSPKEHKRQAKKTGMDLAMEMEYALTRDPKTGRVPIERLEVAKAYRDRLLAAKRLNPLAPVTGISWTERGPDNVGGRSRVAWFDLSDAANGYRKVWAGSVGGGLWWTNDITATVPVWNKVNDFFDNIAVTAFAQQPGNPQIMYFGTGEGWFNTDAIEGLGIWKSLNGGLTWQKLMSTNSFAFVQDLVVDNAGNVYASLRNRTGSQAVGLQKSFDGGITWTQVLGAPVQGPSSRAGDIEIAPNGDVYATLGFFSDGRIYRSSAALHGINAGNAGTWQEITPDPFTNSIPLTTDSYDRIELAIAPSNSNTVYALFEGNGTRNCDYIKRYNAGTNSWVSGSVPTIIDQGSNSNFTRGQAWYDLIAAVDPNNPNTLYIGGVDALRSDDGGQSWTQKTTWSLFGAAGFTIDQNVHADHHMFTYVPGSSTKLLMGTDGGMDYSENANVPGLPVFRDQNKGYNVTQFYACAVHPTNPNYFLAGAQDNGTQRFNQVGINATTEVTGGDGGVCHIDQNEPNIQITSFSRNNYWVSTDGGNTFTTRFKNNNGQFINPTDYDDFANILYGGNTAGSYFRWLSPATDGSNSTVSVTNFGGASVTHVAVSPNLNNRVYFGTSNGRVVQVDDAHTGTSKTGTILFNNASNGAVSCIAIDPANEGRMLVTFSNYGVNSVWVTNNAGASWTSVEGNLPDMPVRWGLFDPRNSNWAILGTEMGVWSTDMLNGSSTLWDPTNTNLANVRIHMLQYALQTRVLAAATHGRGLFTATVPARTTKDVNFQFAKGIGTEATTGFTDCRSFTDYTVNLTISSAPVGNANATIALGPLTTATIGQDFDITTNGNFASPSLVATFASGSVASQSITIRVYNDTEVEGVENIQLVYTLSGSSDAIPGAGPQTHNFAITDNDVVPAPPGLQTVTIGTNDATYFQPLRGSFEDSKTQMLYLASELQAAGLQAGNITSMGFIVSTTTTRNFDNVSIKMKNTTTTSLPASTFETGMTNVFFQNFYSSFAGNNDFTLSTPFAWDGVSNLLIEFCFDNPSGFITGDANVNISNTATSLCRWMRTSAGENCDNISGSIFNQAGSTFIRPVLRIRGSSAIGSNIGTVLNTSGTYYLGPRADVFVYSSTNELLAKVTNTSNHNYGCTEIRIDREGTTAKGLQNNTPSNFVTDKTIFINPTNNNPAGTFDITLYYTNAEVAGWEAATGRTFTQAHLVKTRNAVSSYTPGTVPVSDIDVNPTPVFGFYGSIGRFIRGSFGTGFSGFAVGVPDQTLPVTWLAVNAKAESQYNLISWSTASEQNSDRFEVEFSKNGGEFTTLGVVKGKGTSLTRTDYRFKHLKPEPGTNYYRIRQVDRDGATTFSQVVSVRSLTLTAAKPFVFPTASASFINLNMGRLVTGRVQWDIYTSDLKLVHRGPALTNFVQGGIDVSRLAAGLYILRINTPEGQESLRFVKL